MDQSAVYVVLYVLLKSGGKEGTNQEKLNNSEAIGDPTSAQPTYELYKYLNWRGLRLL